MTLQVVFPDDRLPLLFHGHIAQFGITGHGAVLIDAEGQDLQSPAPDVTTEARLVHLLTGTHGLRGGEAEAWTVEVALHASSVEALARLRD